MLRILIPLLLVFGLSAATAEVRPDFGIGAAPRGAARFDLEYRDLLDEANVPALTAYGADAIRFSSQPGLGGEGFIFVFSGARRFADVSWFRGHPRLGWRRTRHARLHISDEDYSEVAAEVDRLTRVAEEERGQAEVRERLRGSDEEEAIVVCGDTPGYMTERIVGGRMTWTSSCWPPDPEIADYLNTWVSAHLRQ